MHSVEFLQLIEHYAALSQELGAVRTQITQHVRMIDILKEPEQATVEPQPAEAPVVPMRPRAVAKRTTVETRRDVILKWGEQHETFSPVEIALSLGAKLSSMRSTFSTMKGEGILVAVGTGQYMLRARQELLQERKIS